MLNETPRPENNPDQIRPSKEWFANLPSINQWLLGTGGVCLVLGLFCLIGIPILSATANSVMVAFHPHTAEGKREACIANLQRISEALNQYRQDNDGKFPPTEYTANGKRVTWMTLLRERGLDADTFKCPANRSTRGDGEATGGYAFNPVFFGRAIESKEGDNTDKMILVADRGNANDSTLLPPFTGWSEKPASGERETNLAANHNGQVAILYADGHVDVPSVGSWATEGVTWGGPMLLSSSLSRLETKYPLLSTLDASSPAAFRNKTKELHQVLNQLYSLQKQVQGHRFTGNAIEERLWKGAQYLRLFGDDTFQHQLNEDLHLQSQDILSQVGNNWQNHQSEFGFSVKYPAAWKVDPLVDGRYRTTNFKSECPHIESMIEIGQRSTAGNATVLDWTGMESTLKHRYGKGYKRIAFSQGVLGGHWASIWEFELQKENGPRLHKRYLGFTTMWNSVILSTTAPAKEWKDWQGGFSHFSESFASNL